MITETLRPSPEDRLRLRDRPGGPCSMYHTWRNLVFLHWRVEPERIQRTLPPGLFVDVHDGAAYIGIVPFFMCDIRPRRVPALPWLSNFLETNVRTYVHDARGTPGVWFYSLDCNQPVTVWGARRFFHLPYRHARMRAAVAADGTINYRSTVGPRRTELKYRLHEAVRRPAAGTPEFFLVERYVMFAYSRRATLYTGRVFHEPYPIVDVALDAWSSNLLAEHDWGVDESRPEHVCASPGVTVEVFGLAQNRSAI